jgi:hypothetical protein
LNQNELLCKLKNIGILFDIYAVEVAENRVQFTAFQAEHSCLQLYTWIHQTTAAMALALTY